MKSQIKSGAILGYISMFTNIIVAFFYTPVMINLMGQGEYGLYSLVASVIAYLSVLDMGFGNAMIRFISKSQAKNEKNKEHRINGLFLFLYTIIGIITLIAGLILMQNSDALFQASLTVEELAKAKVIMGILVATVAISFPLSIFDSYIMACEKFNFLKILNIIKTVAVPLVMLPILFWGGKSIAMVIVTSVFTIICHITSLIYCFKKLKMKIRFKIKEFDKIMFKEILSYSFFVFLNIIVDNIYNNTDQVILGSVCGTAIVAIYAVAMKISTMNTNFSTTISGLFLPKITKLLEEKDADKKVSDIFIKVSRIQLYVMTLIFSGFIIYGQAFIRLWVGEEYNDAYYIILLLIGPAIIPLTQNIGISIIQAKNKHQFRAVIYIIIAILNIGISIPLAQQYQGIGAAIGTAIATFAGQIVTMNIFYWRVIKIDIPRYWKFFIKFGLGIATITIINILIVRNIEFTWTKLAICAVIYGIVYGIVMYAYMNNTEREYIKKLYRKILKRH